MNAIRKSVWSIMVVGMSVGCAGEPESGPVPVTPGAGVNAPAAAAKAATPTTPPAASTAGSGSSSTAGSGSAPSAKPGDMKKGDAPPPVEGPKAENSKTETEAAKLTAEELAAIKELPAAEQAAAIQQAVCPVSTHHLGSMKKPVKVTAEGRTFYICCDGCSEDVKSDPKGVIAKLDKK